MGHPRPKPTRLAAKLLQIREALGLSQNKFADVLNGDMTAARIFEYERAIRQPSVLTLLAYARLVGISTDILIDDVLDLPETIKLKAARKGKVSP